MIKGSGKKEGMKKKAEKDADALMKTLVFDEDDISIIADSRQITKRNAKEYLTKEDYRFLDNEAYRFYINLVKLHPKLKDYFDYNELNILDFVEEEFCFKSVFSYTMKDIVRQIGIVMKIIDAERPYRVFVKDKASLKNRIAAMVAGQMGLKTKVNSFGLSKKINNLIKYDLLSLG